MTDHYNRIPIRNDLLQSIGRVNWLAIRLHSTVRDRWVKLKATTGNEFNADKPFKKTLGQAVNMLKDIAAETGDQGIVDWCENVGTPAVKARNGLIHAIAITSQEGLQALKGSASNGGIEYTADEIDKVAMQISDADLAFPN